MSSTQMEPFCPGATSLEIYVFRLTHPIDIILFRHLRYVVITWKREVNCEFPSQRASNAGFDIFLYGN